MYFVYIIKNADDKLYVGITNDLEKRLQYHNAGHGAVFTKNSNNFGVEFYEKYDTLAQARNREIQIKNWRRDKKEFLIKRFKRGLPTN